MIEIRTQEDFNNLNAKIEKLGKDEGAYIRIYPKEDNSPYTLDVTEIKTIKSPINSDVKLTCGIIINKNNITIEGVGDVVLDLSYKSKDIDGLEVVGILTYTNTGSRIHGIVIKNLTFVQGYAGIMLIGIGEQIKSFSTESNGYKPNLDLTKVYNGTIIDHCKFKEPVRGIYLHDSSLVTITHNQIKDCTSCVDIESQANFYSGFINIVDNDITGTTGLYLSPYLIYISINNNRLDCTGCTIYSYNGDLRKSIISNNKINCYQADSIIAKGSASEDNIIIGNTFCVKCSEEINQFISVNINSYNGLKQDHNIIFADNLVEGNNKANYAINAESRNSMIVVDNIFNNIKHEVIKTPSTCNFPLIFSSNNVKTQYDDCSLAHNTGKAIVSNNNFNRSFGTPSTMKDCYNTVNTNNK